MIKYRICKEADMFRKAKDVKLNDWKVVEEI